MAPIFAAKCNYCHYPDNAVQVDLTRPFDPKLGVVNRPNTWTRSEKKILVVPGDPEASTLILKVERTDLAPKIDGDPMPWISPADFWPDLTDPFHPERGLGLPSAYGDPRVVPGNPDASLLCMKVAALAIPKAWKNRCPWTSNAWIRRN